ncbi:MAG: PilW family protein [Pseudomonadota bacterium]
MTVATLKRSQAYVQRGMALAEWLLASALGLLILMAALAWLSSSWQLAISQRQPLQMANAGVWLLQRISLSAEMAGFGAVHPLALDDPRLSAWHSENNLGVGKPASDQLTMQRLLDQDVLDCEGTRVLAGNVLVERYFMRADSSSAGWVLACDAGQCNADGCSRLGDAGAALLADIDSLQVLYGVPAATGQSSQYVDATVLSGMSPTTRVLSLSVGVLLHGSESLPHKRRWQPPPDWLGLSLVAVTDKRAHAAFSQTMELPNG